MPRTRGRHVEFVNAAGQRVSFMAHKKRGSLQKLRSPELRAWAKAVRSVGVVPPLRKGTAEYRAVKAEYHRILRA